MRISATEQSSFRATVHKEEEQHRRGGAGGRGTGLCTGPAPYLRRRRREEGGGGGWHKASVSDCLPLAAPIGLSPLPILTLCGPERVLVVSRGGEGGFGWQPMRPGLQAHVCPNREGHTRCSKQMLMALALRVGQGQDSSYRPPVEWIRHAQEQLSCGQNPTPKRKTIEQSNANRLTLSSVREVEELRLLGPPRALAEAVPGCGGAPTKALGGGGGGLWSDRIRLSQPLVHDALIRGAMHTAPSPQARPAHLDSTCGVAGGEGQSARGLGPEKGAAEGW